MMNTGIEVGLALLGLALVGLTVVGLIVYATWTPLRRRRRRVMQLEQRAFRTIGVVVGCCGSKDFYAEEGSYTEYYPLVRYTGPDGLERMVETVDGMSARPVPGQWAWLVLHPDDPGRAFLSQRPWTAQLRFEMALGVFVTVFVGVAVVLPLAALALIGVALAVWNLGG